MLYRNAYGLQVLDSTYITNIVHSRKPAEPLAERQKKAESVVERRKVLWANHENA